MESSSLSLKNIFLIASIICLFFSSLDVVPLPLITISDLLFYLFSFFFIITNLQKKYLFDKRIILLYFIFFFYAIFFLGSAFFSKEKLHGLIIFILNCVLFIVFLISAFYYFKKDSDKRILFFTKSIFYISLVIVCISFLILITGKQLEYYKGEDGAEELLSQVGFKFSGLYQKQNMFGILLGINIISSIYLLFVKKINKLLSLISIIISSILVIMTVSRGAIMFGVILSMTFIYLLPSNYKLKIGIIIILVTLSIIAINLFDLTMLFNRFSNAGMSGRDLIWADAIEKGKNNIFFGLGPNQYKFSNYEKGSELTAHSSYINNFANLGLPAFLLFILSIFGVLTVGFLKLFSTYKTYNSFRIKSILLCISYILGLFAHQLFESNGWNPARFSGFIAIFLMAYILSFRSTDNLNSKEISNQ